jgi:diphthine synthase
VEFPYPAEMLEKTIRKKTLPANRDFIENFNIINEASGKDTALLVYGSPLTATTHIILIQECERRGIKCEIIYNASILDAVAETGLQVYKFGKITSLPNFEADSFTETIKENQAINAHSLILIDIGLGFKVAIERIKESLKRKKIKIDNILVCSRLGTKDKKIIYGNLNEISNEEIKAPFCFIIPGKLHFVEEERLRSINPKP